MSNLPHKACDADLKKVLFPVIVMPKIDGVRAIFINDEFTSRNLKPFRNERLKEAFEHNDLAGYDGELVVGGNPKSKSLCRQTTSFCSSFAEKTDHIELPTWYLFDLIIEGMPYNERLAKLTMEVSMLYEQNYNIKVVSHAYANSIEEVVEWHETFIEMGYEGTVLRSPDGMHKDGRCTKNEASFLKMKDLADEEAVVLDIVEALENNNEPEVNELGYKTRSSHKINKTGKGMIGSLVVEIPDGRVITISAGHMEHSDRAYYFDNPDEIIGRVCTYKYMPYGEKDKRRHPRFKHFRTGDI